MIGPLKYPVEGIAQATSRVLVSDGKAAAGLYLYDALFLHQLYDPVHPERSKITGWEVRAIADRALQLVADRGEKVKP